MLLISAVKYDMYRVRTLGGDVNEAIRTRLLVNEGTHNTSITIADYLTSILPNATLTILPN